MALGATPTPKITDVQAANKYQPCHGGPKGESPKDYVERASDGKESPGVASEGIRPSCWGRSLPGRSPDTIGNMHSEPSCRRSCTRACGRLAPPRQPPRLPVHAAGAATCMHPKPSKSIMHSLFLRAFRMYFSHRACRMQTTKMASWSHHACDATIGQRWECQRGGSFGCK